VAKEGVFSERRNEERNIANNTTDLWGRRSISDKKVVSISRKSAKKGTISFLKKSPAREEEKKKIQKKKKPKFGADLNLFRIGLSSASFKKEEKLVMTGKEDQWRRVFYNP